MKKAAEIIFNLGEEYRPEKRKWQGVPSIEKTGNRLWAAWMTGGKYEPCIKNYGILAYSDDNGENWIDPYMVITCNTADGQRTYEHQLWLAPDGRLWLYWCQDIYAPNAKESDFDTKPEVFEIGLRHLSHCIIGGFFLPSLTPLLTLFSPA